MCMRLIQVQRESQFLKTARNFYIANTTNLIGGDFNTVMNPDADVMQPRNEHYNESSRKMLIRFVQKNDLFDVWRKHNEKSPVFTYHNHQQSAASRIDMILAPNNVSGLIDKVEIIPFHWSDHDAVLISLDYYSDVERGPGRWMLNNALLQEEEYKKGVISVWRQMQEVKED